MFKRVVSLGLMFVICFSFLGCTNKNAYLADLISVKIKEDYYEDFLLKQLDFNLDNEVIVYSIDNSFLAPFTVDILLKDGKERGPKKSTKKIMNHLKKLDFIESGTRHMYALNMVSLIIAEDYREKLWAGEITLDDIGLDNAESFSYANYEGSTTRYATVHLKTCARDDLIGAIDYLKTLEFIEDASVNVYSPNMGHGYPGDALL